MDKKNLTILGVLIVVVLVLVYFIADSAKPNNDFSEFEYSQFEYDKALKEDIGENLIEMSSIYSYQADSLNNEVREYKKENLTSTINAKLEHIKKMEKQSSITISDFESKTSLEKKLNDFKRKIEEYDLLRREYTTFMHKEKWSYPKSSKVTRPIIKKINHYKKKAKELEKKLKEIR